MTPARIPRRKAAPLTNWSSPVALPLVLSPFIPAARRALSYPSNAFPLRQRSPITPSSTSCPLWPRSIHHRHDTRGD
jgi:hypothetical protein